MPLHPDFPVVHGHYQMAKKWGIVLPSEFNRRIEDGDLVLWRSGITAWISIWNNEDGESPEQRLAWIKETQSPHIESPEEQQIGPILFYTYRLEEPADDERVAALYCYAITASSQVQMAVYFDDERDAAMARDLCLSLDYKQSED
jgi:hypothetical protein